MNVKPDNVNSIDRVKTANVNLAGTNSFDVMKSTDMNSTNTVKLSDMN